MRKALLAAVLIGFIAPSIGSVVVLKRLSNMGEAASHSALAGVAFGLVIGINPVYGAVAFSLMGVLLMEALRKAFGKFSEISTVAVLSAGVALTALFSDKITGSTQSLSSFMFGSIVAVKDSELAVTMILCIAVAAASLILYRELFYIAFDEEAAALAGVRVKAVNFVFMVLVALTVSVSTRIVGALMVSSLLVLPSACGMVTAKSYRGMLIKSIIFGEIFCIGGLFASYYLDLRPGGTIIFTGVAVLIAIILITRRRGQ